MADTRTPVNVSRQEVRERRRAEAAQIAEAAAKLRGRDSKVLARVEDAIGGIVGWPVAVASMMLKDKLTYTERFKLTLFLLGNGLQPTLMAEWMVVRKILRDRSARDHVVSLIDAHKTGKLEQKGYTVYLMNAPMPPCDRYPYGSIAENVKDRVRVIPTPTFAVRATYVHWWNDAKRMISRNISQLDA